MGRGKLLSLALPGAVALAALAVTTLPRAEELGTCTTECATAGCTEGFGGPLDDIHWYDGYTLTPEGGAICHYKDLYGNTWSMLRVE